MEFQTPAQQRIYEKVREYMTQLFGEFATARTDLPGFVLYYGSASAQVFVNPWGEDDAAIAVVSWVVVGAEPGPELHRYLLNQSFGMRFGAFAVDDRGDIAFVHSIVGSTCDKNELKASIMAVMTTADRCDDEIVARWGGQRAQDR